MHLTGYISQACTSQVYISQACMSQVCMSQACISQACMSQVCMSQVCISQVCISQACISQACISQACISRRHVPGLCPRLISRPIVSPDTSRLVSIAVDRCSEISWLWYEIAPELGLE